MSDFRKKWKLPKSYLDAMEERRKQIDSKLEEIKAEFVKTKQRDMTQEEMDTFRKILVEEYSSIPVEITAEEKRELEESTIIPETDEQKELLMQFIKEQAKGFFIILELIKEQIELLMQSNYISKKNVRIIARIKGLESSLNNEQVNKAKMEGKLKIVDDIFGITIIANDKKDILTIRRQISNYLIRVVKAKTKNNPVKDENGNQVPGYNAYHDIGYLNNNVFPWIHNINLNEYKEQIEKCIGEENDSTLTQKELEEIYNKNYQYSEQLPAIELHYQTEEEYNRANGIASHTKYKQRNAQENVIDILQKYLHEKFHRFVDIPLMFEWKANENKIRLLERDETLFTIYPYLKRFESERRQREH